MIFQYNIIERALKLRLLMYNFIHIYVVALYEKGRRIEQDLIVSDGVYHVPTPTSTTSKGFSDDIYEDIDKAKHVILDMYEEATIVTSGTGEAHNDKMIEDLYEKVDDLREVRIIILPLDNYLILTLFIHTLIS